MMEYSKANIEKKQNLGHGNEVPPLLDHVKIIFDQQDFQEKDAIEFFDYFEEREWRTKSGVPIKNWKQVVDNWIWKLKKTNQIQWR